MPAPRLTRRSLLKSAFGASAAFLLPQGAKARRRTFLNDASRLNPTPVAKHWVVPPDEEAGLIARLRTELKEAAAEKRPVALGAARHSMGGQSLPRDGTAITFNLNRITPDRTSGTYRVQAGARWSDVIGTLDGIGYSPAVMQSNNDFGVASTFSVNAHGWPAPYGPFGSTVRSLRMMLADGTVLSCSRDENQDLFALAMGGYGLYGIILDLDAEMVPNLLLEPAFEEMPAAQFGQRFIEAIDGDPSIRMAYGRLSVARDEFLQEALMITYRPLPTPAEGLPPASSGGFMSRVSRDIYRAQIGRDSMKRARWFAETVLGPAVSSGMATRNSLMNEPVSNLASRDLSRTDILHEYFIPPKRFPEFVAACRDVILRSKQEFLNVTLRYVGADPTSVLAFAPTRRIAAVMSFSQQISPEAEEDMMRMTEELIDRVAAIGGSFYLPYRLHARRDQVAAIYPRTQHFLDRKRHYDPGLLFRNLMWDTYFARAA